MPPKFQTPFSTRGGKWMLAGFLLTTALACDGAGPPDPTSSKSSEIPATKTITDEEPKRVPDAAAQAAQISDWFEDQTIQSGLDFTYRNGREAKRLTILETVGGGLAMLDLDLDGHVDVYCAGGGRINPESSAPSGLPGALFRNNGSGQFSSVTAAAKLPQPADYSHGCLAGDLNNDGFPDLLVTCFGRNCLLMNQGDGTFADETEVSGLAVNSWNTAAAFGDVNHDGNLDVFICGYVDWTPASETTRLKIAGSPADVPMPQSFSALPDHLLISQGDGSFIDRSDESGIRRDGMGMGVICTDLNQDGAVDFYVANDVVANHLYWGGPTLPLRESGEISGAAYNESGTPEGSMGVDAADVDGDGRCDLWVTNFELEDNSLYLNQGQELFQHSTSAVGLSGSSRAFVKFGTGFCDFDSDGWPDIYVVNGHVRYHSGLQSFEQPPFFYRNVNGTRFVDITASAGTWFRLPHAARGGAVGDLDDDGGPDLVISCINEPTVVLHNRRPAGNWIRLSLVGTRSPRTPVGAILRTRAFQRDSVRFCVSGGGYLSNSDSRILMALDPSDSLVDVEVDWPSGLQESFTGLVPQRDEILVEGRGHSLAGRTGQEAARD